ncbi:MAG: helix-hairpin-helix domain-containing protein [Saprospiraceae bacterium]|nr:helix-hairpin-helix domain-containing protein [Saprospiraceae bacterium]
MDYKEFFSFTKQERRGIIGFIIICTSVTLMVKIWPFKKANPPEILKNYKVGIDSVETSSEMNDNDSFLYLFVKSDRSQTQAMKQKFSFDPNVIGIDSLYLLGFNKYGAKSLINYRTKGGTIYNSEKFKSIFGIDTIIVNELEGLIKYPPKPKFDYSDNDQNIRQGKSEIEKPLLIVELNSADSMELVNINGIGPITASMILKMRNRTGGFIDIRQLIEFKLIRDSMFQIIQPQITINPGLIKKINLNTAEYSTFVKHPYFSSETANSILKYRKQHGSFTDPRQISRIISLKEETGIKILPYLSIE